MNNNNIHSLYLYLISLFINKNEIVLKEELDKLLSLAVLPNEH